MIGPNDEFGGIPTGSVPEKPHAKVGGDGVEFEVVVPVFLTVRVKAEDELAAEVRSILAARHLGGGMVYFEDESVGKVCADVRVSGLISPMVNDAAQINEEEVN